MPCEEVEALKELEERTVMEAHACIKKHTHTHTGGRSKKLKCS